jgi:hypothetical protein
MLVEEKFLIFQKCTFSDFLAGSSLAILGNFKNMQATEIAEEDDAIAAGANFFLSSSFFF